MRGHHAGCTIGCGLFVHGGSGRFGNDVYNDWHLFDFGLSTWIKLNVVNPDGSPFKLALKMHTMTSFLADNDTIKG